VPNLAPELMRSYHLARIGKGNQQTANLGRAALRPGSEKFSDEQLALLQLEPGVNQAEAQAESEPAQLKLPLRKAPSQPSILVDRSYPPTCR
jgi:hypothetical protein